MDRTLGQSGHNFVQENVTLPSELEKLIDTGFRIENDCILFKHIDYFGIGVVDSDFKKTEHEDFENHIHIDDYTSGIADEFEYLRLGLEFAKRIYKKLAEIHQDRFRMTVSFKETTYAGQEIDTYGGCVVRFYMIRPSCDSKFRVDDLDKYETEGVLVME
jgi:hypothetical protein